MGKLRHFSTKTNKLEYCNALKNCPYGKHYSNIEDFHKDADVVNSVFENEIKNGKVYSEIFESNNKILSDEKTFGKEYEKQRNANAILGEIIKGTHTNFSIDDVLEWSKEPDGGGTFNPYTGLAPNSGFCYSPYPQYSKVVDIENFSKDDIDTYTKEHSKELRKPNHYVGIWHDPETSKVYLDISVHSMNSTDSRIECENNDQIAYFDLQCFSSVTVNKNAKSGQ